MRNCWLKDTSTDDVNPLHRSVISPTFSDLKSSRHLTRKNEVNLHQLRSGKCRLLGKFRARLKLVGTESCRGCGLYDETVNHIFWECAATEGLRRSMRITDSKILNTDFELALQFFECVLALLNGSSSNLTSVETRLENAILADAVSVRARR